MKFFKNYLDFLEKGDKMEKYKVGREGLAESHLEHLFRLLGSEIGQPSLMFGQ